MLSGARESVCGGVCRAGVVAVILAALWPSPVTGDCLSHFRVHGQQGGPKENSSAQNLFHTVLVRETEDVGSLLYRVAWDEDVAPGIPDQGDFVRYFHVDDSVKKKWSVTVKESLVGLPDYPSLKTHFSASVVFPAFSDGDVCSLSLSHPLQDDNTQGPVVEASTWFLRIPKGAPTFTPLTGLEVTVTDNDADTPNNLMEVGVEGLCPLEVGQRHYGGVAGQREVVPFHLTSPLNDQVNQTFTCTLRVTDKGSPPLSSLATLILYVVEDVPTTTTTITTTPLALTQPFYLAEVWPGMVVGSPLITFPAPVKVKGCNLMMSQVTYTLRNAWPGVTGEEVFVIDSVTGQVSLARGLDGSWVSGGNTLVVPLLIQAQDSIGRTTTAILQVTTRLQNTTNTHPQPSTLPAPPCRPASPTPCPCLASRSRRRGRLIFTRLSYAAEMFTTDVLVGRVEARLGGRRGSVRYSWASSTNVTTFVMNSISGVITVEPLGAAPGRHLLTARATAGRLTTTAQVSVRVLEDKKEGSGGDWARWDRTLGALRTCEPSDLVGLQVAVGVLAALLAAAVIAAAVSAMLLYRRRKASEARAQTEVKPISTLGSAYPNLSFSRETPE